MKIVLRAILLLPCSVLVFSQAKVTPKATNNKPARVATSTPKPKEPETLDAFKRKFMNQDIIVNDVPFEDNYCLQWVSAQQKPDGSYEEVKEIHNNLPISYRGQTANVISVQLAHSIFENNHAGGTNAFGESVGEGEIENPYMEIVLKFKDGKLAITRGYTNTLVPELMDLASKRESAQAKLDSLLPTVIGQPLYAVAFSKLYKPTASVDDIMGPSEILARLSVTEVPLLQPLSITKTKYLPDVNAVVMKLKLPSGSDAIVLTQLSNVDLNDSGQSFLSKISGSLLSSMPKDLKPREIDAIKGMKVFRGMSKEAVQYAIGLAEKENDWGRGGTQLVYFDGKLLVYLDASGRVEDWQSFD